MKKGDLVKVTFDSKKKYYLVTGYNMGPKERYYILIDIKTGNIITEYEYNVRLISEAR